MTPEEKDARVMETIRRIGKARAALAARGQKLDDYKEQLRNAGGIVHIISFDPTNGRLEPTHVRSLAEYAGGDRGVQGSANLAGRIGERQGSPVGD